MLLSTLKILKAHGYQAIPDLANISLPDTFRGQPVLSSQNLDLADLRQTICECPSGALSERPFTIDLGRCILCGHCERKLPHNIRFTNSWRMWGYNRKDLVIRADQAPMIATCSEPFTLFKHALKLRQVSAGGDNACEMELGAAGNVNFDMRRYGIEFTASPRHADGIVITGPVTRNMSDALEATFAAIPQPRLIIAVGSDAISGGLFADSPAIDRSFFTRHTPHLYVPGHPAHPLTFIGGVLGLIGQPFVYKDEATQ